MAISNPGGFGGAGGGAGGAGGSTLNSHATQTIYGTNNGVCDGTGSNAESYPPAPVARTILQRFDIPINNVVGGTLKDYDIKTQDAFTMIKLSLLQEAWLGQVDGVMFKEVYINNKGYATTVNVGKTDVPSNAFSADHSIYCLLKTKIYQEDTDGTENKIDHVVVRGADPLPHKKFSRTEIRIMGDPLGFISPDTSFNCGQNFVKAQSFNQEAWAPFSKSPQHPDIKRAMRESISRQNWEQAIGYKKIIPDIPSDASISLSQTTPVNLILNFTGEELSIDFNLGSSEPGAGGVTDISNVNILGAQVLDIQTGADLAKQAEGHTASAEAARYSLNADDLYVLLDNQCTVIGASRGENWFMTGGSQSATINIKPSGGSPLSILAFGSPLSGNSNISNIYYFRRTSSAIASMSDFVAMNIAGQIPPTDFAYDPYWGGTDPRMMFDTQGGAQEESTPQNIHAGFGSFGTEIASVYISYSVQVPSVQVRSPNGQAQSIAWAVESQGIRYVPVVVVDAPAPIGYKGIYGYESPVVQPPPPEDENTEVACLNTVLDRLEGTIVDMSAPFLGDTEVGPMAEKVYNFIKNDNGRYYTLSYTGGGYSILPGMRWNNVANSDIENATVHSVEITYSDKDSITTNITLGPDYYEANSYSDSKYVKRSVHLTRTATVVGGKNSTGEFTVDVDGLGVYNAFNGILNSIYPGDRVEVKISNFVVEP